jgi:hypothetical protein
MDAKPCLDLKNDPLLNPTQAAQMSGINRYTLERMARTRLRPGDQDRGTLEVSTERSRSLDRIKSEDENMKPDR